MSFNWCCRLWDTGLNVVVFLLRRVMKQGGDLLLSFCFRRFGIGVCGCQLPQTGCELPAVSSWPAIVEEVTLAGYVERHAKLKQHVCDSTVMRNETLSCLYHFFLCAHKFCSCHILALCCFNPLTCMGSDGFHPGFSRITLVKSGKSQRNLVLYFLPIS